jgi:hypothetical protein
MAAGLGPGQMAEALITKGDESSAGVMTPNGRTPIDPAPQPPKFQVERTLCALPARHHTLWMPGIGKDLINDFGDVQLVEFTDGTAVLAGSVYRASAPDEEFDVFIRLTGRQGDVDPAEWYHYQQLSGQVRRFSGGQPLSLYLQRRGGPLQIGYGANQKTGAYGAAAWFRYGGDRWGHGDLNIELVSCDEEPSEPVKPEWVDYTLEAAGGSGCALGDVAVAGSSNVDKIELQIPQLNLVTDRFAREFCQATVTVDHPEGWRFAVKAYDGWYRADLGDRARAQISAASYFQGSGNTQVVTENLTGPLTANGDIHQSLADESLEYSSCDGQRALNLKVSALVRGGWGELTVKPKQRFKLVWQRCER